MSYGTQRVSHNGSTVTFHRNKSSNLKGYIYLSTQFGGRRLYGRIEGNDFDGWVFVPNPTSSRAAVARGETAAAGV